ncbi:MAG: rhodanese-like domain-containing protein [Candidatus Eremiobacteraeota bacterium]|nr:rhodanese-like domain-containing protein [Candidatus Eremiobacteraeota bacterium]
MREIEVEELALWRRDGRDFVLLDVREDDEVRTASIEGAQHIPLRDVPARKHELHKDAQIVVMCHHGGRSARVVEFLTAQGYDGAINLNGGINEWSKKIDPSVPRY